MEGVRAYLLSVTSAAVFCAIAKSAGAMTGSGGTIIKILCGLFLIFTAISPVSHVELDEMMNAIPQIAAEGELAVETGKDYAFQARERIIKSEAEAYILDKAARFGAQVLVDVRISDSEPQVPVGVSISGPLTAYAREQLSDVIEEDLGIPKEAQQWSP